jgi:CRISPR/Cas system-associated exonuclease Cas4 (RecB family)
MATFNKCPAKFKFNYIDKVKVEFIVSPAMERGTEIHNSLEAFMNGHSEHLHPDIHEHYGQFFFSLRETYTCQPEYKWGIDEDLAPCGYDHPDVMVRGFMDLRFVPEDERVQVFEYKTGKIYPEHTQQQWLYGVVTLLELPDQDGVDVTAVYLDQKQNKKIYYPASMMFEYRPALLREIETIENTPLEEFIPKPQWSCKWCQFSKANRGPCQF